MSTDVPPGADPADADGANYDYVSDDVDRPALVSDLESLVDGDVRFDSYTRQLYATDASAYEVTPVGVVFPTSTDDVAAVVSYCADRGIPVLPRGGGTSLAGQSVNEAVVLDFSRHMNELVDVDVDGLRATAQAGTILGELNRELSPHGLKFAPDPAWGDKSALGGAIGNNSTGAHSLKYGKTDAYVEEVEAVLADGTVTRFGEATVGELREGADPDADELRPRIYAEVVRLLEEEAEEIERRYPRLKRNVSGYNLDMLLDEARGGDTATVAEEVRESDSVDSEDVRPEGPTDAVDAHPDEPADHMEEEQEADAAEVDAAETADGTTGPEADAEAVREGELPPKAKPDQKREEPEAEPSEISDDATVNLARLLAGSEGTLAVITEATVALEPIPETTSVALLAYDDIVDAMEDIEPILEHGPAAVEVMDDVLLDLARGTAEFEDVVGLLPEGTDSVLLVEFYAEDDDHGRQLVADLVADRVPDAAPETPPSPGAESTTDKEPYATKAMEAHDAETQQKFWKMRKAGLPILLSRTSDEKHIAFIEDTAVPAENLPAYVEEFQEMLERHDTFATYYAHAGPGVLHIRPLVSTKTVENLETFESIADEATDLVVKYGGSVSGEHGDGRARTQWNRKLYGDRLWRAFRDLKSAYDPDWLLNPGNICGLSDDELEGEAGVPAHRMTENLRFDPAYEFDAGFEPSLRWENENGFQGMAELCHGCGGCRGSQEVTGGVMCPTFRAEGEEILATRGRANMLRQAMSGDLPEDEQFSEEFVTEVLDLCIGCKGCSRDCPSEVDMAKMKAELTHEYHQRHGASLRDRLFANIDWFSKLGSRLAPLSNAATEVPGARLVAEKVFGIARDRPLPTFHARPFTHWFEERGGSRVDPESADRKVLLFPDTYTNYNHPEAGKAAVRVLEAAGVHVALPDGTGGSGRPPFSKGFIDRAREDAARNVDALAPFVREGWDVVVVEPSDAVMFQSDYLDLLSGDDVETVAANTYGALEYVDAFRLDESMSFRETGESLAYHGHCHQKSTKKDHHAVGVLRRAGYEVDPIDSTCCGMAGSFGYEAEHYSMSKAIGSVLYEQVDESPTESVVAPGASCRAQLGDRDGADDEPPHPVEKVAEALA